MNLEIGYFISVYKFYVKSQRKELQYVGIVHVEAIKMDKEDQQNFNSWNKYSIVHCHGPGLLDAVNTNLSRFVRCHSAEFFKVYKV